jgi:hypothetical protein
LTGPRTGAIHTGPSIDRILRTRGSSIRKESNKAPQGQNRIEQASVQSESNRMIVYSRSIDSFDRTGARPVTGPFAKNRIRCQGIVPVPVSIGNWEQITVGSSAFSRSRAPGMSPAATCQPLSTSPPLRSIERIDRTLSCTICVESFGPNSLRIVSNETPFECTIRIRLDIRIGQVERSID